MAYWVRTDNDPAAPGARRRVVMRVTVPDLVAGDILVVLAELQVTFRDPANIIQYIAFASSVIGTSAPDDVGRHYADPSYAEEDRRLEVCDYIAENLVREEVHKLNTRVGTFVATVSDVGVRHINFVVGADQVGNADVPDKDLRIDSNGALSVLRIRTS